MIYLYLLELSPLLDNALIKLSFLSSASLSSSSGSTFSFIFSSGACYLLTFVLSEYISASSYMLCSDATFLLEATGVARA